MPKLIQISPVIPVLKIEQEVQYFEEKLGFKNVFDSTHYADGPMDYAVLVRDNASIHLQMQFEKDMVGFETAMIHLRIEMQDVDELYEEYKAKEVVNEHKVPKDTLWGTREFAFYLPCGVGVTFFQDL